MSGAAARRLGLVWDERCLAHRNGPPAHDAGMTNPPAWLEAPAYERRERPEATLRALAGAGVLDHVQRVAARAATTAELTLAHEAAHVERVRAAAAAATEPQPLGHEAWVGPGSWTAATVAVGGLLEAVDALLAGRIDTGYVLARPPGHHATADASLGFCLFNAAAVAARYAQRVHGCERVAIVDWDVHHGNGTEAIFLEDPSVLFVSLHQDGLYPAHLGGLAERGRGAGLGANVNVPLPAGCGDADYAAALERVVLPVLRDFGPDLILISAGQDGAAADPLGRMALTVGGFRALTEGLLVAAAELCDGRLLAFQEGGYHLAHNAAATLSIVEALAGLPATFAVDPLGCDVPAGPTPAGQAAVAAAQAAHVRGGSAV
jgi:acetoin utilization deacetylase AcuC-like enzyme